MIRAFPALALMAASLPVLFFVWDHYRAKKKLPSLRELRHAQRPVERMLIGALGAVAVLFAFSALVLPIEAWADWWLKVKQLSGDPHANHISLRSLVAGWEDDQESVLRARLPLYLVSAGLYVAGVVVACRGKGLERCAVLGLVLIPVVFYPANYYIHFVFLLPLLMVERTARAGRCGKERTAHGPGCLARGRTARHVRASVLHGHDHVEGPALLLWKRLLVSRAERAALAGPQARRVALALGDSACGSGGPARRIAVAAHDSAGAAAAAHETVSQSVETAAATEETAEPATPAQDRDPPSSAAE